MAARWTSLEMTGRLAAEPGEAHDLRLDGRRDPAANAAEIAGLLIERYPRIWDGG